MIEQAIYEHPAVQEVIVIGIPDHYAARRRRRLSNCANSANPFSLDELKAFLAGKLGKQKSRPRWSSSMNCRGRRSANSRAMNCANQHSPAPIPRQTDNNNNFQQEVAHDRRRLSSPPPAPRSARPIAAR